MINIKLKIKKYKVILYILIGSVLLALPFFYKTEEWGSTEHSRPQQVIDLEQEMILKNEFVSPNKILNNLAIKFATYGKENIKGKIKIDIIESQSKKNIYSKEINVEEIKDNAFYMLKIPRQENAKNKKYEISIDVVQLPKDSKIAIWGFQSDESNLTINNKKQTVDYTIMYNYSRTEPTLILHFFLYLLIIGFIETLKGEK